jgi:outer membrane protein OmpA-like peptidoglycan-associated protein
LHVDEPVRANFPSPQRLGEEASISREGPLAITTSLARSAAILGLAALFVLVADEGVQAQSTSTGLVERLKSPPPARTRSIGSAPTRGMSIIDRALKHGTRGITLEERDAIADVARTRPNIDMDIPFDYDSSAITARAETELRALAEALKHRDLAADRFLLAGHTDAKGSADYNRALSERRAEAVKAHLVARHGISADRLLAIGYGMEQLKFPAEPLAAGNRRVQVSNIGNSAASAPAASPEPTSPPTSTLVKSQPREAIDGALDEIAPMQTRPPKGTADEIHATGDVTVKIEPGTTVRVGELLSVSVTSRIAGSLIVYEEDAAGQVTQIFPNALSAGARPGEARTTIGAGETVVVPGPSDRFQLRVTPPIGSSRIIAIVLPTRVKVDDLTGPNAGMKPIADPQAVFQTLAGRVTRGVRVERSERAVGVRTYTIAD